MLRDVNKEKIRCYVIADDYRWHLLTDDINEFTQASLAYVRLMNESKKENNFYFKNIFLERSEYNQILKNMAFRAKEAAEAQKEFAKKKVQTPPPQKRSNHLQLVVSNP